MVRRRQPISNERQIKKAGILFVRKFFFLRKLSFMCINSVAKTALQQILHFEKLTYLHASRIHQNAKKYFIFRQEFVSKAKPFWYSFYSFQRVAKTNQETLQLLDTFRVLRNVQNIHFTRT